MNGFNYDEYEKNRKIVTSIAIIFSAPLSMLMVAGIVYVFSWFLLMPIIIPYIQADKTGDFLTPFLIINVIGAIGILALYLVDKYADIDKVQRYGLIQIIVFGIIYGIYRYHF